MQIQPAVGLTQLEQKKRLDVKVSRKIYFASIVRYLFSSKGFICGTEAISKETSCKLSSKSDWITKFLSGQSPSTISCFVSRDLIQLTQGGRFQHGIA